MVAEDADLVAVVARVKQPACFAQTERPGLPGPGLFVCAFQILKQVLLIRRLRAETDFIIPSLKTDLSARIPAAFFFCGRVRCAVSFLKRAGSVEGVNSLWRKSKSLKNFPRGLKPTLHYQRLAAQLKPCPFKAGDMKRRWIHSHVARLQISVLILR